MRKSPQYAKTLANISLISEEIMNHDPQEVVLTPDGITVEPGQTWLSNDPRETERKIILVSINRKKGLVTGVSYSAGDESGRKVKIRINRLRSNNTGYTLKDQSVFPRRDHTFSEKRPYETGF